jgi:hypothetical protein
LFCLGSHHFNGTTLRHQIFRRQMRSRGLGLVVLVDADQAHAEKDVGHGADLPQAGKHLA